MEEKPVETYARCLVKRELTASKRVLKILTMPVAIGVGLFLLLICFGTIWFAAFGIIFLLLCLYIGWEVRKQFQVEFEYTLTGTLLEIDRITAQSRRKHILTANVSSAEKFCHYDDFDWEHFEKKKIKKRFRVATNVEKAKYILLFFHHQYGRVLLIFSPDEPFRIAIQKEMNAKETS